MDLEKTTRILSHDKTTVELEGVTSYEYFQADYFQNDYFQVGVLMLSAQTPTSTSDLNPKRTTVKVA